MLAKTAPMDAAAFEKSLCKLGGTPFAVKHTDVVVDDGLMLPISRINDLRRRALAALTAQEITPLSAKEYIPKKPTGTPLTKPTARFEHAADIPNEALAFFEHIYLPLTAFAPPANGVVLPPVIFDSEVESVRTLLQNAVKNGAKHALVGNLGHLALATEAGLVPHADFRLNVTNTGTLDTVLSLGFVDALLSPELTLPQIRDIHGARDAVIYGRIPLMLLEKCAGKEAGTCEKCEKGQNALVDRRREKFPILRLPTHRNILLNSRPTAMSDRREELARAGLIAGHFIFTLESPTEVDGVINAYQRGTPLAGPVRRI
jgi:putative protease